MAEDRRTPAQAALSDRVQQLERRVTALEQAALEQAALEQAALEQAALEQAAPDRPAPELADHGSTILGRSTGAPEVANRTTSGPTAARPDRPSGGQVSYTGDVTLHGHLVWDIGLTAQAILDLPNNRSAAVLAGLGHPTRAALIRRLLAGPATTAQLQQVVDGSSTGQLYHHLRTLTGCGLAEQDGRGQYRVPSTIAVPALVLLLAAGDIAGDLH